MYACVCLRTSCIGMYTCKHMRRGPSSVHMIFDVFYILRLEHRDKDDKDAKRPSIRHFV